MPLTLYRYFLWELFRLMALTVAVLVTMISFAAAIKPLSDGLLSATALLKFVGYSAPTMLGFALPFAGAFASTLVFIRMAADNEVLACSASGMSYTKILAPVAALGLVLTMGLFYLSNFVVPGFYQKASQTLETDLMSVLVTQLNQNRPFTEIDGFVLYADAAVQQDAPSAEELGLPPGKGPTRFIQLSGIAVAELDEQNHVRADSTAREANILLFQDEQNSRVTLMLHDAMRYEPAVGELEYSRTLPIGPIELESPFDDDPKFLSWPQLHRLNKEPERFDDVRNAKADLAREVAIAEFRTSARRALKAADGQRGLRLSTSRQDYLIKSPSVVTQGGELVLQADYGQPITIEYPADNPQRRIEAQEALIKIDVPERVLEPNATIELRQVRMFRVPGSEPITEQAEYSLPPMRWLDNVIDPDIVAQPMPALAAAAEPHLTRSRHVLEAQRSLDRNILKLGRKIMAQLHERAASALTCLMLLIFGSVLAMHLKGQMPLVVFFWSFLLAIVSLIVISTGENLASSPDRASLAAGLAVIWSGNIGMIAVIFTVYRRLARN